MIASTSDLSLSDIFRATNNRQQPFFFGDREKKCWSLFQTTSSPMFFCAISGEPPQNPVVSKKSGHVYERRLIIKYITDNGTDPVTGEKLEESDLVAVKASTFSKKH